MSCFIVSDAMRTLWDREIAKYPADQLTFILTIYIADPIELTTLNNA